MRFILDWVEGIIMLVVFTWLTGSYTFAIIATCVISYLQGLFASPKPKQKQDGGKHFE